MATRPRSEPDQLRRIAREPWLQVLPERTNTLIVGALRDAADRIEAAGRLIRDFTDPDECWFDHHGGCQAHGYLTLKPGELCPHAEAKRDWDVAR